MQIGKIRIENDQLILKKRMVDISIPCSDILWAFCRQEYKMKDETGLLEKENYIVIITKWRKRYSVEMAIWECENFLEKMKDFNPNTLIGYPNENRIALESLPNTRDLGAIVTMDGRSILPRKLIRSGELYHISGKDQDTLTEQYHLKTIIDFRTKNERENKPDTVIEGVKYIENPIFDDDVLGSLIKRDVSIPELIISFGSNAEEQFVKQYENLVLDDYCTMQYAKFFDLLLAQEEGSVLWHCTMGKDRVGIGTALLLSALGVDRQTIIADYVKTNQFLQDEKEYIGRLMELKMEVSEEMENNLSLVYNVKEEYIQRAFDVIEQEYETVDNYLRKRMFLTSNAIDELKNKYLA